MESIFSPIARQIFVSSAVWFNLMSVGFSHGHPLSLRQLTGNDTEIPLDEDSSSWVASILGMSSVPALFIVTTIMKRHGRKAAQLAAAAPTIMGWVLVATAANLPMLLLGRFLQGFTKGGAMLMCVTVGEMTAPDIRGLLINVKLCFLSIGVLIAHALSAYTDWRTISWLGAVPAVISVLITLSWPESPSWLAVEGRFEDCRKSFMWLRGDDVESLEELETMIEARKQILEKPKLIQNGFRGAISNAIDAFKAKDFRKSLWLVMALMIIMEFSGMHYFPTHGDKIMEAITKTSNDSYMFIIFTDVLILLASCVSCVLISRVRRRKMLFSITWLSVVILLLICFYLYLYSRALVTPTSTWLVSGFFTAYFALCNSGPGPLAMVIVGEIFPIEYREIGSCFANVFFSFAMVFTLKATPYMLIHLQPFGTFVFFLCFIVAALIYLHKALPETQNKTLKSIEDEINAACKKPAKRRSRNKRSKV